MGRVGGVEEKGAERREVAETNHDGEPAGAKASVLRGSAGGREAADEAVWAGLPKSAQQLLQKSVQDDEAASAAAAQFRGTYWNKRWQRFRAIVNGKSFGQYMNLADAVAAVARATGTEVGSLWKTPSSGRPRRLFSSQQVDSEDTSLASSSSMAAPTARFDAFPAFVAALGLPRDLDDMLRRQSGTPLVLPNKESTAHADRQQSVLTQRSCLCCVAILCPSMAA